MDPMFNELTHQDRKGKEITLYTGFPLFYGNLKQTPKSALQSHREKKSFVISWNLGSQGAVLSKQFTQMCPGVSYTTGI